MGVAPFFQAAHDLFREYILVVVDRSPFELHVCCCASIPMFFWASTHPMTTSVAMGRPPSKFPDVFLWVISIQVPYLFLKIQRPCKCYVCCCGPIAIQTPCVHGDGNLYPNSIRILCLLAEIPCCCGLMPT